MHILVLGGNGYLGSKVVHMLAEEGHVVICTIRNGGKRKALSGQTVKYIPASVDAIETVLLYTALDMVINTVCNYGRSEILYGDVIEANIEFPLKILDMAVSKGVKRFITIGTGLPDALNMYTYSKMMFSQFGKFYVEKQEIAFINLKLEMFYGADEPADRFLPDLIRGMLCGREINVTLGTQKRDIISIIDILKAIKMVVHADITGYNEISVGTGIAPTISEIVDFVHEITGNKSIVHKGAVPMRKNEPDSMADIGKLKAIGEWEPIHWKDGISDMTNQIKTEMAGGRQ